MAAPIFDDATRALEVLCSDLADLAHVSQQVIHEETMRLVAKFPACSYYDCQLFMRDCMAVGRLVVDDTTAPPTFAYSPSTTEV